MQSNRLSPLIALLSLCFTPDYASADPIQVRQGSTAPQRQGNMAGYAEIVEGIRPSVVSILSWAAKPAAGPSAPAQSQPQTQQPPQIAPHSSVPPPSSEPDSSPALMAVGSGVILTSNGHILTNSHVVAEAQWIWVVLPGSTERIEAQVLGRDAATDLAVLKIDRADTVAAKFGNSDLMKPGDVVLAIGNAFGLSQTVTSGIISATTRDDIDIAGFENYIQTDAPINPGNSGGALVNSNGEVIGINTAIFSQNGGNVGIGFAINGNLALKIAQKLGQKGTVERGYLGVTVSEVTAELANLFRTEPRGALVNDVMENSPASQAGFKPGDVIVAVNDHSISNPVRFRMAMNELEPHAKVRVGVTRMGELQELEATLMPLPEPNAPAAARDTTELPSPAKQAFLNGIVIEELTAAKRRENGIPANVHGVWVSQVDPAAVLRSRLRPGMIICEVGGMAVDSVAKAVQARWNAVHQAEGVLLLRVWNPGQGYQFTSVRL